MTIAIIDGDVLVYMSIWKSNNLEEGKKKFLEHFNDILNNLFTKDYVMAIGGPDNFRAELYTEYKGNRKKAKDNRPDWFLDLKSWVESLDGVVMSDNCEADDLVRIWALECDKAEINRVVVTVDKDLDCIPGNHYNPRTKSLYQVSEEYAERFYWKQILTGDSVDNIPGLPKVGPVKAEKILGNEKTHNGLQKLVCRAYHNIYGDQGYKYLITNGRLIHIWRHLNDHFKVKEEVYEKAIQK